MDAVLSFLRDMGTVAIGFLVANLLLGVYVALRIKQAKRKGMKQLAEAEERMKAYFAGEGGDSDFLGLQGNIDTGEASGTEDA